jgi:hypothetical protein
MLGFHNHPEERLRCPYKGCEKAFGKPSVLTDSSTIPRQTYYACPHCMSKLDVMTEDLKIIGVKPAEYPKVFESPAKCARYYGFLNTLPKEGAMPDECLICPKVLQCTVRKQ